MNSVQSHTRHIAYLSPTLERSCQDGEFVEQRLNKLFKEYALRSYARDYSDQVTFEDKLRVFYEIPLVLILQQTDDPLLQKIAIEHAPDKLDDPYYSKETFLSKTPLAQAGLSRNLDLYYFLRMKGATEDALIFEKKHRKTVFYPAFIGNMSSPFVIDIDQIDEFVKAGLNLNAMHNFGGISIFIHVIKAMSLEDHISDVITRLVKLGAHINKPSYNGLTPILYAAKKGCPDYIIKTMVTNGADVKSLTRKGEGAITLALKSREKTLSKKPTTTTYGKLKENESGTILALVEAGAPISPLDREMAKDQGVLHLLRP